jgi:hypothetical protein
MFQEGGAKKDSCELHLLMLTLRLLRGLMISVRNVDKKGRVISAFTLGGGQRAIVWREGDEESRN